jgi:hypothetical protein
MDIDYGDVLVLLYIYQTLRRMLDRRVFKLVVSYILYIIVHKYQLHFVVLFLV